VAVVAFDSLGTLFDLGELEERMPTVLHRAAALTLSDEWAPLAEVAQAVDAELAEQLRDLDAASDAKEALALVREAGHDVWVLTNGGRNSTLALLDANGLAALVDEVHSVDEVRRFKPHPDVYALLPAGATLVAAHDWDVAGARAAGVRAVMVERGGWSLPLPPPELRAADLVEAARLATRR
jgi:2-haloacid dehalogenase